MYPRALFVSVVAAAAAFVAPAWSHDGAHGNAGLELIPAFVAKGGSDHEVQLRIASELLTAAAEKDAATAVPAWFGKSEPLLLASSAPVRTTSTKARLAASSLTSTTVPASALALPPNGNGTLMGASFSPFQPKVRYYWDGATFYLESDNTPDGLPNRMVGITSWQQQIPLPIAYFANTTNPENNAGSLGFGQPNYWRLPLVPTVAPAPTLIFTPGSTTNNFQRGAIALASNGVAIFNPANNTGRVSYEIGELDTYGGHCGLADDYHYHIIPTHLYSRFGGPLGDEKPAAWALDGYPIYGFVEPDGSARQALDANGGHDIGNGWGYHYHAIGTNTVDATHPYGTPQSPYTMTSFRGTVANFGGQVDGQPEVGSIRASGTGGYTAQAVSGASIVAFKNPVALTTDGSGHFIENTSPGAVASADAFLMRVSIAGTSYDECWKINRNVNPRTLTVTWRLPGATTTTTYTPNAGTASGNRLTAYPMGAWSMAALPDTSQVANTTATFGEDSDYTTAPAANPQSFTDNGNGTITDNVTGLMWQKVDAGEMTWENAVNNAAAQSTGGYSDWRLPNPQELMSLFNFETNNPALDTNYFPNNPSGTAQYYWSRDAFGTSTTNIWCANEGGGLGGKPKAETLSAGGAFRYHARYVRGAQNNLTHRYTNNGDGTITDNDTSLMWTQLPSSAVTWEGALTYAESLATGGYSDWRLPNIKELQTITDYNLATVSGGSATNTKPCINRTVFAKTLTNVGTTAGNTTVTCADTTGMVAGMVLVDPNSVAGTYISNTNAPTVASVVNGTTFTMSAGASSSGSGLTLRALPVATAYWSSTSLKGDTTKAWLLELGVNNSVPAADGPPRGSQGIISYQAKTATFPVFAVRTAVLTTQITVVQGTTTLTDGVSTVSYGNVNVGSSLAKTFTINNTGSTALTISGVTIDGTHSANFSVTNPPATSIAAGGNTTFTVLFNALTSGNKVAALHIASSDAGNPSFDINLAGVGFVPPPSIANVTVNPISPSSTDPVVVTAQVTPGAGSSVSTVQLSYDTGGQTTTTVLNETMTSTATVTGGWDGTGAAVPWTVVTANGAGNIQQTTGANHTTAGQGGTCGVQFSKGSTTAANLITTTNSIDLNTATSAAIEFWTSVTNINADGLGWSLQLATDAAGTNWTTVASELNVANHGFTKFRYDLSAAERVSTLRLRFNFFGNGVGGGTGPRVLLDDITLVATTGNPPTVITMFDDGLHGDGAAGDGIYGATIPAQANGATVNFTISAVGSGGSGTTTSGTTSYTVAPAPTITTASPLPAGNTLGAYSQTFAATGGSGTSYTWSLFSGSLPAGLTLSSGGVLSGTPTAAGNFSFTVKVTDSATRSATKAFNLAVSAQTAPNVVIIITDDQGWADVGYHTAPGQVPVQTPNMDSFASTGIRMERFYCTTVCSVTRSTLLTGRHPIRHGTNNARGTDLSEHLMPQSFKAAGYQTYLVGKWHMGGSDKNLSYTTVNGVNTRIIQEGLQYAPYNRGFDSHYGQYSGAIDYFTHWSAEAENPDRPDWWLNGVQVDGPSEHTDSQGNGGWAPDLEADKAIAHIQNRDPGKPMYLQLAFNSIHGPVSAPPALITKYANLGVTNTQRRLICAALDGMDQAMGRVLAALDAAGISNNTIVLWFGDNGGDETKGSLNDPLRGDKGDSYEGGLREVAGIRWPGVLPAGVTSRQYMWVGDVFPTLCAATGVTPQNTKPLDGVNVWPNLLTATSSPTTTLRPGNATLVTDAAAPIAINQFTDPVNGGTKDFKLRRSRVGTTTVTELFNLTDDEYETTDLAANGAYASIVTSLTGAVTAITSETFKPYVGPALITNTVAQGGTIELYAPFTSYRAPTVQWRKNGVNVSGATTFTQVTDTLGDPVTGAYTTKLVIANAVPTDAGSYDVVVTNVAGFTTSDAGTLTVTLGAPTLTAPSFAKGTSATLTWLAVGSATSYTVQRSATSDFATVLGSQTTSGTTVTFTGLTSGATYYYRATATDGVTTSAISSVVSSTQDASAPVVTITAPANNAVTNQSSINVQGTATDTISPITGVTVNGVAATSSNNFATWSATVPLNPGANIITATATDSASSGGNTGNASVSVSYNATGPTIVSVSTGPTSPTYLDPTTVLAQILPANGTSIAQVRLQYETSTPVTTRVWQEVFANTSSNNWNGTGGLYPWTTVGGGVVRQAVSTSNRTSISITGAATTSGSSAVTCNSTAALWPGMLITGPNIPGSINGAQAGNTTVASITNATTFQLSQAATATGSGLTLTAAGVTLTNATTTTGSTSVSCDSTAGLVNGMSLSGTGLANNATVASVTSATTFTMNVAPTTAGSALTLSAGTAAAEFNGGTANLADSMFTTTNAINASGASGYVEFWVQTRDLFVTNNCGWALQVSPDNGANWNTRLTEDWNSETATLSNVVLNSAGAVAGSTTVTCASTTGLTTGRSVLTTPVNVTIGISTGSATATCANTTGLVPGMFITATGVPNNTRIGTITANTSFTLVTGTTATAVNATATNASAAAAASYFASNATVSSITDGTTFVLNTPAYANTSAAPLATAFATTVNHGIQLFHYDLAGAELGPQTKLRFQATGYSATAPTRTPRISIDDIMVATTAPPPTITLTMYDDGLHGDGAAGDGIWGAAIPAQAGGIAVTYRVLVTDSNGATATGPANGSYTYTVSSSLTDSTIKGAEFLGMPKSDSVTINLVATVDQYAYIEYGTVSGSYTAVTPTTLFAVDPLKPEFYNPIEITLTGLQPDTEYYYRVRHRDASATSFKARGERSFHTARPRGTDFVFTVTADPHLDVNSDLPLFLRAMANIGADGPDFHIDLGDIFMTDKLADGVTGIPVQFFGGVLPNQTRVNDRALFFRNQFEVFCHSVPFFYTQGNHEAEYGYLFNAAADKQSNIPAWNLKARKAFYPTPVPDLFYTGNPTPKDYTGGTLGLLENYYAFEWGDALFITLDPYWNTTTSPNQVDDAWQWTLGKDQYDWLKATLQNSSARYKFVFMHHIVGGSTTLADGVTKNVAGRGGVEVADKYEWGGLNADGVTSGFATRRPGWDMPIHQLLVANKVNVVFHGHDHLYAYQTLDGVVYLECPQPGTPNFTTLGSAGDGKYTTGVLLPNSGHIRVSVSPRQAMAEYVRAYRSADETATVRNRDVSHSFTISPQIFAPVEITSKTPSAVNFRWNAIPNRTYSVQWSPDLVSWSTIGSVVTPAVGTNGTYVDMNGSRVSQTRGFYRVSYTP